MKLHNPDTEKALMEIARHALRGADFQKPAMGFWRRLLSRILTIIAVSYLPFFLMVSAWQNTKNPGLRSTLCALMLMLLARLGVAQIALAYGKSCFFSTLANLPIRGHTALTFVRYAFFRLFWLPALTGSFIASLFLHNPVSAEKFPAILATCVLLTAIVLATAVLSQAPWFNRLRIIKMWYWMAVSLIGYSIIIHFLNDDMHLTAASGAFIEKLEWVFPPTWLFPKNISHGGLIPAIVWIVLGAWRWLLWPSSAFPLYDRPLDIFAAFGNVGKSGNEPMEPAGFTEFAEPELDIIDPGPPLAPPSEGWVDRLIVAAIPPPDLALAGAMISVLRKLSRTTTMGIFLAPIWLLAAGFGPQIFKQEATSDLIQFITWALPVVVLILGLMPITNPLKGALAPCAVGSTPVPVFTTLPISLRSILRVTFRITIVRTVIAVLIAAPFFWLLAKINHIPEIGNGLLAAIPAIGTVWIFAVPTVLANRIGPHLRRKRGILILTIATDLVQVAMVVLWIVGSLAGIGSTFAWASGQTEGRYAFLLLPAAIACLAFGGAMSRLHFESLHLSLRQNRYDWKSKIR